MTAPVSILIVDDEPQSRRMLRALLAREGHRASEVRTAGEALAAVRTRHPDLVLLELDLPDADGVDVIRSLRDEGSTKPIIVVSSRDREEDKVKALELLGKHFGLFVEKIELRDVTAEARVARLVAARRRVGDAA